VKNIAIQILATGTQIIACCVIVVVVVVVVVVEIAWDCNMDW
jgi:hypothetical protein